MSDVVRSMSRSERATRSFASRGMSGGFRLTPWIVLVFVAACVYAWWISRDTQDVRPFILSDPAAVIVAHDAVVKRDTVFSAPAWNALPESARTHPVPSMFATDFEAPDWISRNLFGRYVLAVTPAEGHYDETIYISKMSRFGVIIERALRRSATNRADAAGGLDLRHLEENGIYYAVRGRLLVAAASRRALIRALTLDASERIADEEWDDSIWNAGAEDVRGTVRLAEDSRWGHYFAGIGFALRVDAEEAVLKLKMPCTDAFYSEFIPSLEGKGAARLYAPESGPIQLSADIGATYEATFRVLEEVLDVETDADEPWLVGLLERNAPAETAQLLSASGTAMARTWHGYALNDIVPAHVTSSIVSNSDDAVSQAIADASTEASAAYEAITHSKNVERDWLEILTIGGPALTQVIALDASQEIVLASTSRVQAELNGWDGGATVDRLEQPGNLFIRIDPGEVLTEYEARIAELEAGFAITQSRALELNTQVAQWREQMRSIREIELVAEHDPGTRTIQTTLTVR